MFPSSKVCIHFHYNLISIKDQLQQNWLQMDSTIASLSYLTHAAHYFSSFYYHCEMTGQSDGHENMMEVRARWVGILDVLLTFIDLQPLR